MTVDLKNVLKALEIKLQQNVIEFYRRSFSFRTGTKVCILFLFVPQNSKVLFLRSRALDTASILGGNEFMLSQTFHELHDKMFTSEDLELLKWALGVVWADYEMEYKSQRSFTNLFLPNAKRELASKF